MNCMMKHRVCQRAFAGVAAIILLTAGLGLPVACGEVMLVAADLQSLSAVTQGGWTGIGRDVDTPLSPVQALAPTAVGSAVGITATLGCDTTWNARGQDRDRAAVAGTNFDGVVSDLWFTRSLSYSVTLGGLAAGTQYTLRGWHNDSYTVNEGAAAGGGIVTPTLSGGTLVAAANGTITNLSGSRTDAAFGIATLVFTATSSSAVVTMTRSGGSFTGIPVSGLQLTTAVVPEPGCLGLAVTAIAVAAVRCRRAG